MGFRILIVEDDFYQLKALKQLITADGISVEIDTANCAADARDRLTSPANLARPYDIMLLDLGLPEIEGQTENSHLGLRLLEEAHKRDLARHTIVISGKSDLIDEIEPALKYGAADFFQKPYEPDELIDVLLKALSKEHPAKLFICHDSVDKDLASSMYRKLAKHGFAPWMADEDLLAGQNREFWVNKTIREADFALICLSRESIRKSGSWLREIKKALEKREEMLATDNFLIPVLLEPCDIPDQLAAYHPAYLYEEDGWRKLARSIYRGKLSRSESE
ncbi:MAG: TIR domain-containing protein [Blastocatellia bacterium]|nr:TIR domain-containing protein [Blastocatellia bacterium]